MPRLYVSVLDIQSYPVSLSFSFQITQLQAISGALDKLIARASKRVDAYCDKRLGQPGVTTVGTGGLAQGGTVLPVTSTLGFDNIEEQAIVLGTGGNQETIAIANGGVSVTTWSTPYPGTITLAAPTQYAHSAGEAVQGCYQEVCTVGSSASLDVYSDELLALNQAAQLARAHAPQGMTHNLTRVIMIKNYPITSLLKIEHMLPIDTSYETLDASQVGIHPSAGYLRLPIGSFVLPDGLFRSTYIAGYQTVPDDVQEATMLYAAAELQYAVSQGAYKMQQGKRNATFADAKAQADVFIRDAQNILNKGYRRRT